MFDRLRHMLIKEFIQIYRDPRMRAVIMIVPIIQVMIFGYAVTTDVRNIRTGIMDLDNSVASRALISRFTGSGYFQVVERLGNDADIRSALDHGEVKAVLRFDRGFGEDIGSGKSAQVQLILDGTDSNTAGIVLNYAAKIASEFNQRVLLERVERHNGQKPPPPPVELRLRAWFNPNLVSRDYFVPGVIALLLMVISMVLSSISIVREKEIGTIEQIMVTPIGRLEFILGKMLPFVLIGYVDVVLISLVAVYWFNVPIVGNPLLLFLSTGFYLMSTLGVGLFISTVSQTQQQALMTAFFFLQPAILLSGFIFPIANMPRVVQVLTYLDPLRYFLVIIRGIFLKGVGFHVLWPQMLALTLLGAALLALASLRFHKTLA
ncbi:MAG TPA: ABC transporter permease [Thermoanaerobaculia bacterium]|nr:ABC transporter permease [Thermoanaerobaculia bacterium]